MKALILTTPIGVFGVDEKNEIIVSRFFKKDPERAARKILEAREKMIEEEEEVLEELKRKDFTEFVFNPKKSNYSYEKLSKRRKFIKLEDLAIKNGFVKDREELSEFLTQVGCEISKIRIRESIGKDSLIIQAVRAIEELDRTMNILVERLREWYGLHFPEIEKMVKDHKRYAQIVSEFGSRDKILDENIKFFARRSMGIELDKEDEEILIKFSTQLMNLFKLREALLEYLETSMKEIAPNVQAIAGTLLGAKLIGKAGSLEKLAKMASSTIQLIGAEKALFRYLRGKGKSPKHGLIYIHPYIQNAPKKLRGKIARVLASKLSIAAKIDCYTKKPKPELKEELEKRIREILSG